MRDACFVCGADPPALLDTVNKDLVHLVCAKLDGADVARLSCCSRRFRDLAGEMPELEAKIDEARDAARQRERETKKRARDREREMATRRARDREREMVTRRVQVIMEAFDARLTRAEEVG